MRDTVVTLPLVPVRDAGDDDGSAALVAAVPSALLRAAKSDLAGRVRERHDVGTVGCFEAETTCEIRVQDVEAARSEPEVASLRVDDHRVALLDRPRESRIRDA